MPSAAYRANRALEVIQNVSWLTTLFSDGNNRMKLRKSCRLSRYPHISYLFYFTLTLYKTNLFIIKYIVRNHNCEKNNW